MIVRKSIYSHILKNATLFCKFATDKLAPPVWQDDTHLRYRGKICTLNYRAKWPDVSVIWEWPNKVKSKKTQAPKPSSPTDIDSQLTYTPKTGYLLGIDEHGMIFADSDYEPPDVGGRFGGGGATGKD